MITNVGQIVQANKHSKPVIFKMHFKLQLRYQKNGNSIFFLKSCSPTPTTFFFLLNMFTNLIISATHKSIVLLASFNTFCNVKIHFTDFSQKYCVENAKTAYRFCLLVTLRWLISNILTFWLDQQYVRQMLQLTSGVFLHRCGEPGHHIWVFTVGSEDLSRGWTEGEIYMV